MSEIHVLCILVFGISLWVIASPTTVIQTVRMFGNSTFSEIVSDSVSVQVGITGAVIGGFIFFISAMGFYGAVTGSHFLLFMYATLVLLLMLLECALVYYFSSNVKEKGLHAYDKLSNHIIRIAFHCCDRNNTSSESIPWSCCDVTDSAACTVENKNKKDCKQEFSLWWDEYQTLVYLSLTVVHVILSSCSLLRRSYSASRSHT
ncbi:uncharacterized protein LOC123667280 [Melitaea cinxia]|uniref:uncharacterized protein LOC123667280 n=1 Tax=Melitaea cinxia TaxID=113334 RepID=UPI001E273D92|nr:uncharacterized protein LOC123667280 [Melitaea cinxia]